MKILQVIPYFAPAWQYGGPISVVLELSRQLGQMGHAVTVLTTTANGARELDVQTESPQPYENFEVIYCERVRLDRPLSTIPYFGKSVGFFYSTQMKQLIPSMICDYDIVHLHEVFCYPALLAARAARQTSVPYLVHLHGMLDTQHLARRRTKKRVYLSLFGKTLLEGAAGLIALTMAEKTDTQKLGFNTPIACIPNAATIPDGQSSSRGDLGDSIDESHTVVLFMGRIHPTKGLDLLVKAFAKIASRNPRSILVIAGPDETGYRQDLVKLSRKLDISGRIRFTGTVAGTQKDALLQRADLFALTSYSEGFSISILEAMAFDKPVVITDACNFEQVQTCKAGLVSAGKVDAIADNLQRLLGDSRLRAEMGRNARKLIQDHYTWKVVAEQTLDFYRQIIENK